MSGGEVFECSPLYLAAMEGHAEVVTALLQAGADKEKRSLWRILPRDVGTNFFANIDGFSIKPRTVKLLAGEQKATEEQ